MEQRATNAYARLETEEEVRYHKNSKENEGSKKITGIEILECDSRILTLRTLDNVNRSYKS